MFLFVVKVCMKKGPSRGPPEKVKNNKGGVG